MAVIVVMPKQGNTVESCILTKWFKHEGDAVKTGEPLFAYETDKSAFEEAAQAGGTVLKLLREEGDDVPVMEAVCVIGEAGEAYSVTQTQSGAESTKEAAPPAVATPKQTAPQAQSTATDNAFKASPRAQHLAERMGLSAGNAVPTGSNGRVIERDIWALASGAALRRAPLGAAQQATDYEDAPLSNIRKRIAESMHKSLAEAAQLTHHSSADATQIMNYRARAKQAAAAGGANITLNDMVLYVISRVLLNHPDMNAHFLGDKLRRFKTVNLGVAVDTDRGLMVPTLFHAETLSLAELSAQTKELAAKCRAGAISPDMLSGGTFTVSNLGVLGVELYTPVLNPPQTGIIGVCNIVDRIRRKENGIDFYPAMGISLTYDHRAVDGAPASRFLQEVCKALSEFETFLANSQGA